MWNLSKNLKEERDLTKVIFVFKVLQADRRVIAKVGGMPKMLEEQQEEQVFEAKSGMIRHAFQKHNPYFFYCK